MPPLDLDAVVCGDAFFSDSDKEEERADPYAPAESLRLRIGEDIDWSDVVVGGSVLQRDDSTKGAGANPKSSARRSVQHAAAAPRKVVPVAVIGGLLPPAAAGSKVLRCSPCRVGRRARVFAAAAGEQHQQAAGSGHRHLEEPGSPKVSCLGAVRPEQRPAGRGTMSRRPWWRSWFAARVTCCFSSHRSSERASKGNEADD